MTKPSAGLMAFHLGHPVECIHRIASYQQGETWGEEWLVRPLFVDNPVNRIELFRDGERLTPIHSKFA